MTPEIDLAELLFAAIRSGDLTALTQLLAGNPGLESAPLEGRHSTRTPLHVAADWPGYFPNGPQVVRLLIEAGADPNARSPGDETPLHWAASSDDSDVAEALIEGGADVDAPDGSIGTPLANAVGYGCWHVARLLVDRGAKVDAAWQASALGMLERLEELLGDHPDPGEVSKAFWHACAAGQRRAADYLLARGADLNWVPDYADGAPLDAAGAASTRQENLVAWLRALGAHSSRSDDTTPQ
jgi:ankyrin repeat protein